MIRLPGYHTSIWLVLVKGSEGRESAGRYLMTACLIVSVIFLSDNQSPTV